MNAIDDPPAVQPSALARHIPSVFRIRAGSLICGMIHTHAVVGVIRRSRINTDS